MPAADAAPTEYEFHPIANRYPLMDKAQLNELAEDIKAHGQEFPGYLHEGKILVGRNRYKACKIAGVEFWCKPPPAGKDPDQFAASENLHRFQYAEGHRRELLKEQAQRVIQKILAGNSQRDIAKQEGVSRSKVQRIASAQDVAVERVATGPALGQLGKNPGPVKPESGKVKGQDGRVRTATPKKPRTPKAPPPPDPPGLDERPDPTDDRGDAWEPPAESEPEAEAPPPPPPPPAGKGDAARAKAKAEALKAVNVIARALDTLKLFDDLGDTLQTILDAIRKA